MTAADAAELMKAIERLEADLIHANPSGPSPLIKDAWNVAQFAKSILSAPTEGVIAEIEKRFEATNGKVLKMAAEADTAESIKAAFNDRATLLRYIKSRALTDRPDQSPQDTPPHPPGSDS